VINHPLHKTNNRNKKKKKKKKKKSGTIPKRLVRSGLPTKGGTQ